MISFMSTNSHVVQNGKRDRRLIGDALDLSGALLAYRVGEWLHEQFPAHYVLVSEDYDFNIEAYAKAGHCELRIGESMQAELTTHWVAEKHEIEHRIRQGWLEITWQGMHFEALRLHWPSAVCGDVTCRWLIAETAEAANAFFCAVCEHNSAVGDAIMVFQDGYWEKNRDLHKAIKQATMDNLVLGGNLKHELFHDLEAFFRAEAIYAKANLPWKRGVVLIGPPGNGKTHAIKALINALGKGCLYVKSFSAEHVDDHRNIRTVFEEAREKAPCILVLEDLDSLVTDHNRSFFLNELDGFATNQGVVTIASTNYPEKLDPAIMARPSRFDRKYHFGLPEQHERQEYLTLWSTPLDAEMQPTADTIAQLAEDTGGFSFAYLKELLVSSTIRWVEQPIAGSMDEIMPAQLVALREQMGSG
jgi:AAA+ superfamily predicted ATPase